MGKKTTDVLTKLWGYAMVTVITLGLVGVTIALAQWILKLVGVL